VESITKAGAEIHNYQPTPGDLVRGARCRPHPVERPQSRTLVRTVPVQPRRSAIGGRVRRTGADRHRIGALYRPSQSPRLDVARGRTALCRQYRGCHGQA
jgi:hypothetical protein